jgi:hypothetical protein
MQRHVLAVAVLAACASRTPPEPLVPAQPLSAEEHRAEAERRDREASQHDKAAGRFESGSPSDAYRCGDTVLFDQSTSGGERLSLRVPCWTAEVGGGQEHRRAAASAREDAARHRTAARQLESAEGTYCSTMAPDERDHGPFWHRSDILTVQPIQERGVLRGANILFRRVPSLTKEWMEQAVRCHQARAASLGWDPMYMGYDPSAVADAHVVVSDDPAGIRVIIRSQNPDVAAVILGRAQALLEPELEGVKP